jgi:hypothetical protein
MSLQKIFLFCTERSGSNLITKLMNAHTQICGPSTKHILNPTFRNLHRYTPIDDINNWYSFIDDLLNLFYVDFSSWHVTFTKKELIEKIKPGNVSELFHYIFDKESKAHSKSICFIKEIKTYEIAPQINYYLPESKYLYLVRDPRDMALSWKKSTIHKGSIVTAARQWKIDQQQYLKHFHLESMKKNILLLHYEQLISESKKELNRVFSFIGVENENVHLSFHKDAKTMENAKKNDAWKNISKGLLKGNKEKYLKELSSKEISIIEFICRDEMNYFSYKLKSSEQDLNKIKTKEIDELQRLERTLPYTPPPGVANNMKAKARFYQK